MAIIEKMMEGWSKGVYERARELMVKREREWAGTSKEGVFS